MLKPSPVLVKKSKPSSSKLLAELKSLQNQDQAQNLSKFFKTGPGQYGAGDQFLGIMVPVQRQIAKKYVDLSLTEVIKVLHNPIHECRLVALLILVEKYRQANELEKKHKGDTVVVMLTTSLDPEDEVKPSSDVPVTPVTASETPNTNVEQVD